MSNVQKWIHAVTAGASHRAIAERIGASNSTVSRWFDRDLSPSSIVTIARAYDANPVEGLRESGLITQEEINLASTAAGIETAPLDQLMLELARRARLANQTLIGLGIKGGLDGLG